MTLAHARSRTSARPCEAYELNFPTGVPFESLNPEIHAIFVRRGRLIAFQVLEPCLPRAAAICPSEAIAEGVWHVSARELAGTNETASWYA